MDDEELRELQDPANWEDEGIVLSPAKNPSAVYSVPFSVDEARQLELAARTNGENTIEFIRRTVLERAGMEYSGFKSMRLRRTA